MIAILITVITIIIINSGAVNESSGGWGCVLRGLHMNLFLNNSINQGLIPTNIVSIFNLKQIPSGRTLAKKC